MGGECSTYGGRGEVHTGFWRGKPRGKKPLGRHRRRWKDNIKVVKVKIKFTLERARKGHRGIRVITLLFS